ncbi:MAG: heavy-metal-associated domain-containing protein [Hyphomicrobium sp.]
MDITFAVSGMHCGRCLGRINQALSPFAETVDVTISPQRATLRNMRPSATLRDLQAAISTAGPYTISPLNTSISAGPIDISRDESRTWLETYWPLILIVAYIAVAAFAGSGAPGETRAQSWMTNFMAGFFLVFSAFKFLDLKGFADAYASYDLLAARWPGYGYVYPFFELALGLSYLFRLDPGVTNIATIALMSFSSLGVLNALSQKRSIQCACLGTVLKLPMSTITLVEDLGMAAMAAAMLLA